MQQEERRGQAQGEHDGQRRHHRTEAEVDDGQPRDDGPEYPHPLDDHLLAPAEAVDLEAGAAVERGAQAVLGDAAGPEEEGLHAEEAGQRGQPSPFVSQR